MNIINGGAHADNDLNIQEFMIRPTSKKFYRCDRKMLSNTKFEKIITSKKMLTNVGDEGGFAPSINSNEEVLELIVQALKNQN